MSREVCHCGHAKSTHHEGEANCLGMGCDDCPRYRDEDLPDTLRKAPVRRDHTYWCRCYDCSAWEKYVVERSVVRR
jgi:hypothetical protein